MNNKRKCSFSFKIFAGFQSNSILPKMAENSTYSIVPDTELLQVHGARVHNLKNIHLSIPRNKLVVFTGMSGSGKSSLAFDTIFAEGQRRYMESFSAYARQFMGDMERPDVDKIDGLSPVIAIEQKTTNKNPRSTVGTITEVYDFLRLLFARIAVAHSYVTGKPMLKMSEDQIREAIHSKYLNRKIAILAPLVRARKGHYRELFETLRKQGFTKARVDGAIIELTTKLQLDRYKSHDIELVVDRLEVSIDDFKRLGDSLRLALKQGKGIVQIMDLKTEETAYFSKFLMDAEAGISYDEPQPNTFSFNSPYGACPTCNGLGTQPQVDLELIFPDKTLSLTQGGCAPFGEYRDINTFNLLSALAKKLKFSLSTPVGKLPEEIIHILLYGYDEPLQVSGRYTYAGHQVEAQYVGLIPLLNDNFQDKSFESLQQWAAEFMSHVKCTDCNGSRLRKESLHYFLAGKSIGNLVDMPLNELLNWIRDLPINLNDKQQLIGNEVIKEIRERLGFLVNIGLSYLTLNRPSNSLSGGESQRIRLATQIGSQLVGVLYILDEPSIGLHQRDNDKLIKSLKNLRDQGNTVLVVEHDKDMILESDYVVDIGPGAGFLGGEIVSASTPTDMLHAQTITAQYLNGSKTIPIPITRRLGNGKKITINGATGNNLKNVTAEIPLGKLICITGVSGSGKSSLINETLAPEISQRLYRSHKKPLPHTSIEGIENIDKIITIDQSPIGRTPRSNPATYTGVFTDIRNLFADIPEAKIRGYKAGRFSFNVKGGRCETCHGAGMRVIEMNFLPDVEVACESCQGRRYNRETLDIRYKGKNINDVLNMPIDQALVFFEHMPQILRKIASLADVGLGYLTLGQSSTTLSGGEAQRVKLAAELAKRDTGNTLYLLDEPTTGLHFEDINILMTVINKLVDKGNTILIVEHNLDVIKLADWIIDIGPDGGNKGGNIVFAGTPEDLVSNNEGFTAHYLRLEMQR